MLINRVIIAHIISPSIDILLTKETIHDTCQFQNVMIIQLFAYAVSKHCANRNGQNKKKKKIPANSYANRRYFEEQNVFQLLIFLIVLSFAKLCLENRLWVPLRYGAAYSPFPKIYSLHDFLYLVSFMKRFVSSTNRTFFTASYILPDCKHAHRTNINLQN